MKVVHLIIYGYVQGVGYRQFVKHTAKKLGLTGWVRNLPEGTVEAEVAGAEERVEKLIAACKKGPLLSEVSNVNVEWIEKDFEYQEFVIRHDME